MTPNEYFDEIYCINLDRRPDRFHSAWSQFNKFGMYVKRFPAIDKHNLENNGKIMTGELGCLLSHMNVVKKCRDNKSEKVLIFEDDVMLRNDFWNVFERNIAKIPEWDMIFLGGNHVGGLEQIDEEIFKMKHSFCTHAYVLPRKTYDVLISNWEKLDKPSDVTTAEMHEQYNCYVIKPSGESLAWQKTNFSDIQEGFCNYDHIK